MLVADLIAAQFGSSTEVVLHDFTGDLDHSIVYIVNGRHGENRRRRADSVFPALHESQRTEKKDGKDQARISPARWQDHPLFYRKLFDEDGTLNSSLCINQDITDLVALENAVKGLSDANYFESSALSSHNRFDAPPSSIHGMMDNIITEGLSAIGTPPDKMNKEAKIKLLKFLDERGVFLIQKSGQKVCSLLGISKFTLYNYLEEIRGKEKKNSK